MNAPAAPALLVDPADTQQGIGASPPCKEDQRFLPGRSQHVGDIRMPDLLDVAFVRAPVAHARGAVQDGCLLRAFGVLTRVVQRHHACPNQDFHVVPSSCRNVTTVFSATVSVCASTALPLTAAAQGFACNTVRVVVPFPPDGSADLSTRAMGTRRTES